MLLKLFIENYALIQKLDIDLSQGLTVITGETGAGKSILVGALSLILGNRADSSVLLDPKKKCIIEGAFKISNYGLESFFHNYELDFDDITILRREINQNGKSRAFINDTPVNLSLLKELGDQLVNVHSQHSIITLNDANFQIAVLDNYAGHQDKVNGFREQFRIYDHRKRELDEMKNLDVRNRSDMDYLQFLLDELVKANLIDGEQEELENRQELLTHAGDIKSGLMKSNHLIEGDDLNILSLFADLVSSLSSISGYHENIKVLVERLVSNQIDIKDISSELKQLEESIEFEPDEAERVSNRLDLIYRLEKKHQVKTLPELIGVRQSLENKLMETTSLGDRIEELENELQSLLKSLSEQASAISRARKHVSTPFEKEIILLLANLGMPSARFRIEIQGSEMLTKDGTDKVRFLFSANAGVELSDLAKVASGGELSRLMLSIKSMITQKNLLPTVIFDEIDNGVSGEVAGKVGKILRTMSETMQVIVITHLPQIAGTGSSHFWVFKKEEKGMTQTLIRKLKPEERVQEIAKMLSSEKVTEAAQATARELLGSNNVS